MSYKYCGEGIVNETINRLPFELHLPGYQFCGPGTNLHKRLARGDLGINPLDAACKEHDIAYSANDNIAHRHEADRILQEQAWQRVKASDATYKEKAAAWLVTNVMKAKRKMGMGVSSKKRKTVLPRNVHVIRKLRDIKKRKTGGRRKHKKLPRILPMPKIGGFLPLLPAIFAGLSALGGLAGGTAGIVKAVNEAKEVQKQLDESQRHNKTMEAIALSKSKGSGLFLKPYKKGSGLSKKRKSKN